MLTNKEIPCRNGYTVSCPVESAWCGVCRSRMFSALLLSISGDDVELIVSIKIDNFIKIALNITFLC